MACELPLFQSISSKVTWVFGSIPHAGRNMTSQGTCWRQSIWQGQFTRPLVRPRRAPALAGLDRKSVCVAASINTKDTKEIRGTA